jgi:transcriptional regulator of aromatic amino acid metabolism
MLPVELRFEWDAVVRERCNVLVEALPRVAGQVIEELRPHLRTPIYEHRPKPGVAVPQPAEGTLVLLEVENLGSVEQARLLRWLYERNGTVQVVATSTEPIFPSVERGSFDAALYYRLNIVRLAF